MSDPVVDESSLQRGRLLCERGDYREACRFFAEAIQAAPEDPQNYLELALAQGQVPAFGSKALRTIDRAVALVPDSSDCLGYKAHLQSHFGLYHAAVETAGLALEIDPGCRIALLTQAHAHAKLEEWDQAGFIALKMLEIDPADIGALNLRAQALRLQGRHRESREVIEQIARQLSTTASSQAHAGYEAMKVEDYRRANEHFLKALSIDPGYDPARLGLLKSLRSRGWMYLIHFKVLSLSAAYRDRLGKAMIFATFLSLGLLLIPVLLYALFALTLQPISNFFLSLDSMGSRALQPGERRWAWFTGGILGALLIALALAGWVELFIVLGGYLLLFAFSVYLPQWADAWWARQEERDLAAENVL